MKNLSNYIFSLVDVEIKKFQIVNYWTDTELEELTEIHKYYPSQKAYVVYFEKSIYAKDRIESEYTVKVVYHFTSIIELDEIENEILD
jgi:hypothetical protein